MGYELEACEIASFADELECDSAEGDVDTVVPCLKKPQSPEPGILVDDRSSWTHVWEVWETKTERCEEGASAGMVVFSDQWLQYYLGMLHTDSATTLDSSQVRDTGCIKCK